LKKIFILFFLIIVSSNTSAQNFYLKIIGQNDTDNKKIDSIGYAKKHENVKSIITENNSFYEKLTKKGYTVSMFSEIIKLNDSTFCYKYDLGKKINYARIYIGIFGNLVGVVLFKKPKIILFIIKKTLLLKIT
jgi:hypothetical protein